ncbi:MAG: LptA/OstA family protein [Desulfohalobiaceae bacterium]
MYKIGIRLGQALGMVLLLMCLCCVPVQAEESGQSGMELQGGDQDSPTKISSQKMVFSRQENKVEFLQDVYLERTDLELWCEKLTVFLASGAELQEGPGGQDFERMEAEEQVRIKMENRTASSKSAVYERQSQTLVLEGDVQIQEGPNQIQGQKVTIYLQEDKSEVSAGEEGDRIRAVFFPEQEEGGEPDAGRTQD